MKSWLVIISLLIGFALGIAVASVLNDPGGGETEPEAAGPVPQPCLNAIAEARDRLLLNPDVLDTLEDYQALGREVGREVSNLQVPNLRETLGRFNDLNARSDALIERSLEANFTANANECERLANESEAEAPS